MAHCTATALDRHGADRSLSLHALPAAYGAVLRALHRPGVFVQRFLLHLRRHADHVSRRQTDRLVHRRLRSQQLSRCVAAQSAVRHRRPCPNDRGHLHRLRHPACHNRRDLGLPDRLCGAIIFFFASAGASSAYLTVSEIFPLETRALCIAFFYAIGTAAGGIAGPLLFGSLIDNASGSGDITKIALGYFIGAGLMIAGGVVEAVFGVKAERQTLEHIATPLTVEDAREADSDAGRTA
jgi:hypothetical protein